VSLSRAPASHLSTEGDRGSAPGGSSTCAAAIATLNRTHDGRGLAGTLGALQGAALPCGAGPKI